jgi:hypothetical protein
MSAEASLAQVRPMTPPTRRVLLLGSAILTFGILKLVSPFRDWYAQQVSGSGLPALAYPLGIICEIMDGALFLVPVLFFWRSPRLRSFCWMLAAFGLIGIMLVATYVHLHPAVPAEVLPLKVKPPLIPLAMLLVAAWTAYSAYRSWPGGGAERPPV